MLNKFPEMTFKSKSVKRTGQNTADVTGDLTLHGVTKEAVLKVELLGKGAGPQWDDGVWMGCYDYAEAERFWPSLEQNDRGNSRRWRRRAGGDSRRG